MTPWTLAATLITALGFSLFVLVDCSPQLPATVQNIMTVSNLAILPDTAMRHIYILQVGWWIYFGNLSVAEIRRVYAVGKIDCILPLGAYQVCDATQSTATCCC
jgi:hypothetical protein